MLGELPAAAAPGAAALDCKPRADALPPDWEGSCESGLTGPCTWVSPPPKAKFIPVGMLPV